MWQNSKRFIGGEVNHVNFKGEETQSFAQMNDTFLGPTGYV